MVFEANVEAPWLSLMIIVQMQYVRVSDKHKQYADKAF